MLVDFCVALILSTFIFIYESFPLKLRLAVMLILYLIITTACTYMVMTVIPLLLNQKNWTRWKFFLCSYLNIIITTLAYLLLEQFSVQNYGFRFHLHMNEEHTFMQNFWSMLTFDCIAGTLVCAVIYFFIVNNEMNALLHAKENLRSRMLSRKSWTEAQTPDEKITLSGRTKDSLMLNPSHILYMEVQGNYVDVYYLDESGKISRKTIRTTIQQMEYTLENYPTLVRCHRTYIVNIFHVEKVNSSQQGLLLLLKYGNREIPVSRTYRKNFRSSLDINRFLFVFV
jgi:hypothetical protein